MKNRFMSKKISVLNVILFLLLSLLLLFLVSHLLFAVIVSLKNSDYDRTSFTGNSYGSLFKDLFAIDWNFENYIDVFNMSITLSIANQGSVPFYMEQMLLYSVLYAGIGGIVATFIPFLVAYITSRYNYWFCKLINAMVIVVIALPIVGAAPATIQILNSLGLYDTFIGMFVLKMSFVNMYYLIFYASFVVLPKDFHEAANIDGASELYVMTKIMFPMLSKVFVSVFLIMFVTLWNDYQTPLMYLYSYPTLSRGVFIIFNHSNQSTPVKMAACTILLVPILIIFSIFSKRLMGGISLGGLKE